MKKRRWAVLFAALAMVLAAGALHGQSDLCLRVDMKPVLSLEQITQAELVHYMLLIAGFTPPSPEGKTPEQYYQEEVKILVDNGYPPVLSEVNPDELVTRRYYASVMFQLAVATDKEFAQKYGDRTEETEQWNALVESEWMYSEGGKIYKEEILSVLCTKQPKPVVKPAIAIEIFPETIQEANVETPKSPL